MQGSENYELDPNFAVVCSFLERFGKHISESFADLSIDDLKYFLEAKRVDLKDPFVKLHLVLFRGIGHKHRHEEWVKGVIKFCKDFPDGDDTLVREKGYTNIPVSVKLRILKNLFEDQFEYNDRFNRRVNEELNAGTSLRHEPVGKDKLGRSYWFMLDKEGGLRLFRGWYNGLTKDETWNIVCSEVDHLESLIETLEEKEDLTQEDLRHEDPTLPKPGDMSPLKKISCQELLTTATEDAANAMYFSSIMSSPRYFKPPKSRSKAKILQEEDKYDLPHCDVKITRLSQREFNKYSKKNSDSQLGRKGIDVENVINDSAFESGKRNSDIKSVNGNGVIETVKRDRNTDSIKQVLCTESIKSGTESYKRNFDSELRTRSTRSVNRNTETISVKKGIKTNSVNQEKQKESVDCKSKAGDSMDSDSESSADDLNSKKNQKSKKAGNDKKQNRIRTFSSDIENSGKPDKKNTKTNCKERHKCGSYCENGKKSSNHETQRKCSGLESEHEDNDTDFQFESEESDNVCDDLVQDILHDAKGTRSISNSCRKNSQITSHSKSDFSVKQDKMLNKQGSEDSSHACKQTTKEVKNDRVKKKKEEIVSEKEKEKNIFLTDCRGDAGCKGNNTEQIIDSSKSNLSSVSSNSEDEKEVFDNAIQDLIQLEGKCLYKCLSKESEAAENNETHSQLDAEGFDPKKTKSKKTEKEKQKIKQDKKDDSDTESDNSMDSDKKVIDNALKDLIQLEEMISQGSPASTCMSSSSSNDLNKSRVQENRTRKGHSSKEYISDPKDDTLSSSDDKSSGSYLISVKRDKKIPSDMEEKKSSVSKHDGGVCEAAYIEAETEPGNEKKILKGKMAASEVSEKDACGSRNGEEEDKKGEMCVCQENGVKEKICLRSCSSCIDKKNILDNSMKNECDAETKRNLTNVQYSQDKLPYEKESKDKDFEKQGVSKKLKEKNQTKTSKIIKSMTTEMNVSQKIALDIETVDKYSNINEKKFSHLTKSSTTENIKVELKTQIKETCQEEGELPINEFLTKIMSVIEGKGDKKTDTAGIKTEKPDTSGHVRSLKAENGEPDKTIITQIDTKCSPSRTITIYTDKYPGLTKSSKTESVDQIEKLQTVEPKCEVIVVGGRTKNEKSAVEKKPLSMMVGDEMIHIEEVSDNSDDDVESAEADNKSETDSASENGTSKTVGTLENSVKEDKGKVGAKIQEMIENNLKVVNETEVYLKSKPIKRQPKGSKVDPNEEKEMMKSLYISNSSVENSVKSNIIYVSSGNDSEVSANRQPQINKCAVPNASVGSPTQPNIIYIAPRNDSRVSGSKQSQVVRGAPAVSVVRGSPAVSVVRGAPAVSVVRGAPAVSVVNSQKKPFSVAELLKTVNMPVVSVSENLKGVSNMLPANRTQVPALSSLLIKPGMPNKASVVTYSLLGNNPSVKTTAAVTMPYVPVALPRIIYASGHSPVLNVQQSQSHNSAQYITITPKQNSFTTYQKDNDAMKSLVETKTITVAKPNVKEEAVHVTTETAGFAKKEEPVKDPAKKLVLIVKGGVDYDTETGLPQRYRPNKKLVIAGPRGKFYDRDTGYEVNIPSSENFKHIPGAVYMASNVTYTEEVMKQIMAGKLGGNKFKKAKSDSDNRSKGSNKKGKKKKYFEESTTSDEEFEKMLDLEESEDEESDDPNYDYEKISQRIRAAKDKKLPASRGVQETTDSEEASEESEEEMVPLVLGRNAKRAAARKGISYKEPADLEVVTDKSNDEAALEAVDADPCKMCNTGHDPSTILLCDRCDGSYHMSCLSPPLSLVPLEDWFCPKCEHEMLIEILKEKLNMVKKVQRKHMRYTDRISQKTFSIDMENIVVGERRSRRSKKEVIYDDTSYDKMIHKAVKDFNNPKKNTKTYSSSDSEAETDNKHRPLTDLKLQENLRKKKASKRQRDGARRSSRVKKKESSGISKAKKRKLTSLEDESGDSGSDYIQSDRSNSSDTEPADPDEEDMAIGGTYFTSSGRKTKHVSYT